MPVAWYIVPYVRDPIRTTPAPGRTLSINIDDPTFKNWRDIEVLGNRAIVKVNAGAGRLAQYDAAYKRLPDPDTLLSDTSAGVRTALRNELSDMGYTAQEINQHLPNPIGTYTMRQVMNFMRRKRRESRWDVATDTVVLDGAEVACESIATLDREV